MKPQSIKDKYLHKELEQLDEIDSPALRRKMRESKRRVKRAISKAHRQLEKNELRCQINSGED